jgi:hypothetical protein
VSKTERQDAVSAQRLGSIVGAVFGLVYVLVNAGPLPRAVGVPLQGLGLAAFAVVLLAVARADDHGGRPPNAGSQGAYWLVVAAVIAALAAGLAALNGPLDAPQAGVAWVSFVVGVHFVALGAVFREPFFHRLGGAIGVCGLVGLAFAAAAAGAETIAVVSGIVPGALLLASGWWGARQAAHHPPHAPAGAACRPFLGNRVGRES